MRNVRLFGAWTLCSMFPISLAAPSISAVPVQQPAPIPQPAIHVRVPLSLEVHAQPAIPTIFDDSDRELSEQEQETIHKAFSMSGAQHKSLEVDNVWGST